MLHLVHGPEQPYWELRQRQQPTSTGYALHVHDSYSLGQVLSGQSRCQLGQQPYRLPAGHWVWIAPHYPHACNPHPHQPWAYRMLHLAPDWLEAIPTPRSGLIHATPSLAQALDRLTQAVGALAQESALWSVIAQLARVAPHSVGSTVALQPAIARAQQYLYAHACENFSLTQLAQQVGLSPWQLLRGFRQQLGIAPHALQLSLRIAYARHWLRQGLPLAEAALQAGFVDQSHFSHAFKRYSAQTPKRYAGFASDRAAR